MTIPLVSSNLVEFPPHPGWEVLETELIRLKVIGTTCQHCERAVSEALAVVPGVDEVVDVSHECDEATVEGSPNVGDLISAVTEEGYEAEIA